jgi:YVTN family beta-propeller protein
MLGAPLEDPAVARIRGGLLLAGGLTAADTSSDELTVVQPSGSRALGHLPMALHDAAAAPLRGSVYVFGGGGGTAQLDAIERIDPRGRVTTAGRLPAASSDSAAATADGVAYIVGGYTGTAWLDTIVAFRPGSRARTVAHLPTPIRYAAVTAAGHEIVIAGGSLPEGTASRAVYRFDPRTRRIRLVATLPHPTTHASAVALGPTVYVIGGRGATLRTPTEAIEAIDVRTGRVRPAGSLPAALSDLGAGVVGGHVLVIGGSGVNGVVGSVDELAPRATAATGRRTRNVYAADRANALTGAARTARPLIYVPNSLSNTVDVIDPRTYKVVEHFAVGRLPQHVVPSWDLKTLYVTNDSDNTLTAINPQTGRPGRTIPVDDPYNMYFTPNGRYAIVVAERLARLDFRDPHTFKLAYSLPVPCRGVDHMDFSADGSFFLASCEFSSQMIKVDVARKKVVGTIDLPHLAAPQDVKLSPAGDVFYVADMINGGVWLINGAGTKRLGFIATGAGAHGLYPSRDASELYVTNRSAGTISVLDFATRTVVDTWTIPRGSPDMGNVSADGKVLWVSGRYGGEVYALSTTDGRLLARIKVGLGPHGLCVWPQPGRYSLGHTGILR